jgi:hypothetical protein
MSCDSPPPGNGPVGTSLSNGAKAADSSQSAINVAKQLEDPKGLAAQQTGGPNAQGASAGDTGSGPGKGLAKSGGPDSGSPTPLGPNGRSRGGSGSSGAGGGGGSGAGGELKTDAIAGSGSTDPALGSAAAAGSDYKSAGGGAAGTGGGSESFSGGFSLGGSGGAAAPDNNEVAMGAAGQTGVAALGSEDPDDYFTRTGLGDNLFKKVEKVYRTKSMSWASTTALPPKGALK